MHTAHTTHASCPAAQEGCGQPSTSWLAFFHPISSTRETTCTCCRHARPLSVSWELYQSHSETCCRFNLCLCGDDGSDSICEGSERIDGERGRCARKPLPPQRQRQREFHRREVRRAQPKRCDPRAAVLSVLYKTAVAVSCGVQLECATAICEVRLAVRVERFAAWREWEGGNLQPSAPILRMAVHSLERIGCHKQSCVSPAPAAPNATARCRPLGGQPAPRPSRR